MTPEKAAALGGVGQKRTVVELRRDIRRYQYNIEENERLLKTAQDELFDLDPDLWMRSSADSFLRSMGIKGADE